mmetsp:Transcript_38547/g.78726  ORF Transcript_38547/g.78726 Transcript_38547/m.78726 type:complete len:291 (-) Transcript_38547:128-1000(-)
MIRLAKCRRGRHLPCRVRRHPGRRPHQGRSSAAPEPRTSCRPCRKSTPSPSTTNSTNKNGGPSSSRANRSERATQPKRSYPTYRRCPWPPWTVPWWQVCGYLPPAPGLRPPPPGIATLPWPWRERPSSISSRRGRRSGNSRSRRRRGRIRRRTGLPPPQLQRRSHHQQQHQGHWQVAGRLRKARRPPLYKATLFKCWRRSCIGRTEWAITASASSITTTTPRAPPVRTVLCPPSGRTVPSHTRPEKRAVMIAPPPTCRRASPSGPSRAIQRGRWTIDPTLPGYTFPAPSS